MTVWIPYSAKGRTTYHTRKCPVVQRNEMKPVSFDTAKRIGLRGCKQCRDTSASKEEQDWSYQHALKEAAQND